ncbi:aklaviketone reductase DauE-like [Oppia nitens]|uniref:aklaviketone reductase DauE-like n=1 Tax=Oppia nitens TaxID=1686743 RepID=UPI0023DC3D26|nr:aklaviketone reductase DauE-like [Oppia nitens]
MKLNLYSMVLLTHLSVDHLSKTRGNIVNISSIAGLRAFSTNPAYCMAKCSIDMFTKCCAAELGPKNIRVNVINPGPIKTGAFRSLTREQADTIFDTLGSFTPVGRAGQGREVADTVLYLASDHARFVTGTQLVIDGGMVAANSFPTDVFKKL